MFYFWRTVALVFLAAILVYFWHEPILLPLKIFVVYFHEVSHALAVLLTGGKVISLKINWDESGFVTAKGGNLIVVSAAGYLGSIFWGSLMLHASVRNERVRLVSLIIAVLSLIFPFLPEKREFFTKENFLLYAVAFFWGFLFFFLLLFSRFLARLLLFFVGGLSVLYSVYDLLNDFISSDIMNSDAGLIALHLVGKAPEAKILAYVIAILISILSVSLLIFMIKSGIRREEEKEERESKSLLEENHSSLNK